MDSWEWNKIAGAVLGTLIFVMVIRIGSEAIFEVARAGQARLCRGRRAEAAAATGHGRRAGRRDACPIRAPCWPRPTLPRAASVSKRCEQCHDLSKGGPNKIGPNLWGVVDRPRGAAASGFFYSSAMKAKGGTWTYEELFKFLKSPGAYIPGTKMSFAGLRSETGPHQPDRLSAHAGRHACAAAAAGKK